MEIFPVIMCGGSGTRLWPLSKAARPKQFIPLIEGRSTFQQAVLRLSRVEATGRPVVVTGARHARWVEADLRALGLEADVLLEPTGRDSGPAVAAALAWIARKNPAGVAVIVAADQYIPDEDGFAAAINLAAQAAGDWIVTLGLQPTEPSPAFGYIRPGAALEPGSALNRVSAFVEKPDAAVAAAYCEAGYLWNSGNFIAGAQGLLEEFRRYSPAVVEAAEAAVAAAEPAGVDAWRLGAAFETAPKISVDYAVMEKTARAAVLPVAFEFSDLGTWEAVWRVSSRDGQGNLGPEGGYFIDARDCLVRTEAPLDVACIGVSNLAVIADGSSLLICSLDHSQAVKGAAARFPAHGLPAAERQIGLEAFAERYQHWLATAALPLWWSLGSDHRNGGFHDLVGLDGRPVPGPRRARVQTRQVFVYATAHLRGLPGPWLEAAGRTLDYFIDHYRRPDGLYRTLIDQDGAILDDRPFLYDQAFALLAKAALYRCGGRPELRALALQQLAAIRQIMSHPAGGFREAGDFPFQANAHMHLLEAALAWREAEGDPVWTALADEVVALARAHFIDAGDGALREFFSADWTPAPGADGGLLEPGHQFEWAWLLERWVRATGRDEAGALPRRLFQAGVRGVDLERAVAVDELNGDFSLRSGRARLWPQTEYIKAALLLAERAAPEEKATYLEHAKRGAGGLWRYLDVPTRGLWRDKQAPDGQFETEPAPASSLYHIIGAVQALADWRDQ